MKKNQRDNEQMALAGTEEAEILARLSERVEKAVATIQELRKERDALRARAEKAEAQLADQTKAGERLAAVEEDVERFRAQRSEIRNRIETILGSLEALEGE